MNPRDTTATRRSSRHRRGGCACGAVRFELLSSPIFVQACHCSFCQRMTGSAFSVNALLESDRVFRLGQEPEAVPTPSALPAGQIAHRCGTCRVRVWSTHASLGPRVALIHAGCMDEPTAFEPELHCFVSNKMPWVIVPDGVPSFDLSYSAKELWSEHALARLQDATRPVVD